MNPTAKHINHNHLGSANLITTATAAPTQFLLHLPYGEEFVKQLSGSYGERFTFTGKEKDIETGYYYFGARFDNVDLGFMSVDPMSDKYTSISPYAYCAWNPVKLVDPEGEDFEKIIDHEKKTITIQAQFYTIDGATEKQKNFLQKALDAWNSCSAVVSIPIEETGETEDYTICFNLINNKEKRVAPLNAVSFLPDDNFDKIFPEYIDAGGISSGRHIYMRNSSNNNQLLAHEIGHCLGMLDHNITIYGLMFWTNSNFGNVSVASLGCTELGHLLSSCGFKGFEYNKSIRTGNCINTLLIGDAPQCFENAVLSDGNIIKTDTKKFIK